MQAVTELLLLFVFFPHHDPAFSQAPQASASPRTVLVARTINSDGKPTSKQMKSRCLKQQEVLAGEPGLQASEADLGYSKEGRGQLPLEACPAPLPQPLSMSGLFLM